MKAKHDELAEALDGMFDDHHGELAQMLLDQITALDGKIAQLGSRIEQAVAAIPAAWGINADGTTGPELLPDPHRHQPPAAQPHPADPSARIRHHHNPHRLTPIPP
jgi:hypothetical protein